MNVRKNDMQGIRHTGIYVKNLDVMISFYREMFDLNIVVRQKECGAFTDMLFDEKDVEIEVCKLEFHNKTMIELIQYSRQKDVPDWSEKIYQCGKMHIAITVDSANDLYEILRKKGCRLLSKPCDSPDGKVKVFFARDPEGNYLELVEELNNA